VSINLPNIRRNFPAYPGIAPSLNLNHPAMDGIRMASIVQSGTLVSLVDMFALGFSSAPTIKHQYGDIGPSISISKAGVQNSLSVYDESPSNTTLAAIFTFATEASGTHVLVGPGTNGTSPGSLNINSTDKIDILNSAGSAVTFSPALPTLIAGHSYFVATSSNATKSNVVLVDLSTGKISKGSGASLGSFSTTTAYDYNVGTLASSIAANYFGVGFLNSQQLLQWAQDPFALWYDNSTRNVMQMAVQGASATFRTLSLSANDATDTAVFDVNVANKLALSANDATDSASFNVTVANKLALSVNDATDTAAFAVTASNHLALSANDAVDTAAFDVTAGNNLTLSANDASDTAAFAVNVVNELSLASNDAADTASFNVNVVNELSLAATDAQDVASFVVNPAPVTNTQITRLGPGGYPIPAIAPVETGIDLSLAANDATDTASFVIAAANKLALAATDAQDVAAFNIAISEAATSLILAANDAEDVASFNIAAAAPPANLNDGEIIPQWLWDRWRKRHKNTKDAKAKREKKQIKAILELPVEEIKEKIANNDTGLHGYDEALKRLIRKIDENEVLRQKQEALEAQRKLDQLMAQQLDQAMAQHLDNAIKQQMDQALTQHLDQSLTRYLDNQMAAHLDKMMAEHKKRDDEEAIVLMLLL
jgi:hypothetical protein